MRLVFTTIGSSGDLFPLLPVARGLAERGHGVSFAANESFRAAIEHEGFAFVPIGVPLGPAEYARRPEIFDDRMGGVVGIRALMRHFILPHLERVYTDLAEAARGADALLTHPAQLAAPMVAEALGLRWATLSVFPGNIPSSFTVPQGSGQPVLPGRLGRLANAHAWRTARLVMRALFDRPLNAVRRRLGRRPGRDLFLLGGLSPESTLLLCSEAYCGHPPDWPASIRVTGYTCFDTPRGYTPPAGLTEFLDAGEPPVLVSLGTSVAVDPQAFFTDAEAALTRRGRRGLFLGTGVPAPRDPSRCAAFPYAPLSQVLPACALAIHPGGFGTTAAVLTAGLPTVAVPRAFDQAYHAERIVDLGVGRRLPWRRLSAARLEHAVRETLADPAISQAARAFAKHLASEDGVGRAVHEIERFLARA